MARTIADRLRDDHPDFDWSADLDGVWTKHQLPADSTWASNGHVLVRREAVREVPDAEHGSQVDAAADVAAKIVEAVDGDPHDVRFEPFNTYARDNALRVEWDGDPIRGRTHGYVDGDYLIAVAKATWADGVRAAPYYRRSGDDGIEPSDEATSFVLLRGETIVGMVVGLATEILDEDYAENPHTGGGVDA